MNSLGRLVLPPLQGQVSDAEWQARVDLAACYRLVAHFGMSDMMANHITIRVPGFQYLCNMLSEGKAWVKISGADRIGNAASGYADVDPFAKALINANIENHSHVVMVGNF